MVVPNFFVTPHPPPKVVPLPPLGKAFGYSWTMPYKTVRKATQTINYSPSPAGEGGPQSSRRKPWRNMSRLEDGKRWMRCGGGVRTNNSFKVYAFSLTRHSSGAPHCGSGTLGEKQHSVVFLYPRAASLPFWEGNICKATSFSHSKNIIPKKRTPIESPKMRKKEIHPKAYLPSSAKKQNLASPPYLVSFFFNLLDFTCFCTVLLCFVIFSPNSNCIPKIKSIINHIAIFFLIAA